MAYDINKALERLERNLAEVDSAKKQVEDTIAASKGLLMVIGNYSSSLETLNKEVSKFILEVQHYESQKTSDLESAFNEIRSSCGGVIANFKDGVRSSVDFFNAKFTETVSLFSSENSRLAVQVSNLNSIHAALNSATNEVEVIEKKLDVIAKNLDDSQKEQDRTLDSIQSVLGTLPTTIKSQMDDVKGAIDTLTSEVSNQLYSVNNQLTSVINKLDGVISSLSTTQTICQSIKLDIDSLSSSLESEMSTMNKSININRWIMIAGFVALIVLHLIRF